jgi:hypothetical protein
MALALLGRRLPPPVSRVNSPPVSVLTCFGRSTSPFPATCGFSPPPLPKNGGAARMAAGAPEGVHGGRRCGRWREGRGRRGARESHARPPWGGSAASPALGRWGREACQAAPWAGPRPCQGWISAAGALRAPTTMPVVGRDRGDHDGKQTKNLEFQGLALTDAARAPSWQGT